MRMLLFRLMRGGLHFPLLVLAGLLAERATVTAQPYQFAVTKSRFFIQTNATPPVLDWDDPYVFVAQVCSDDFFFILSDVRLTPPGQPPIGLALGGDSLSCMQFNQAFATKAALDAAFPAGRYVVDIEDIFGDSEVLELMVPADEYPVAPFIRNYKEAQAISTAAPFDLEWPLVTGPDVDAVGVLVVSNRSSLVHRSVVEANPSLTTVTIPAGTLFTGSPDFAGAVDFHHTANYVIRPDDSETAAAFSTFTQLALKAPFEPYLRLIRGPSGEAGFRFNAIPGRQYRIDSSTALPEWAEGLDFTADEPYEQFLDFPFDQELFHRVVLLP